MTAQPPSAADDYPDLPKSYKGFFPFKIATTSFIYPDQYLRNAQKLGSYMDEIQLLFLEGKPLEGLPDSALIDQLASTGKASGLTYNIHLPIDIYPGSRDRQKRLESVQIIGDIIDLCASLKPTSYTLHVPLEEEGPDHQTITQWQQAAQASISEILLSGLSPDVLAIETLHYPFEWIESVIQALELPVCIDFGHLALSGQDIAATLQRHFHRTAIMHLHGFKPGHDHLSLDHMDAATLKMIMGWLKSFSKTVSLEVFSYQDLNTSLAVLEEAWQATD
ncbi:MAG: cobamide remodeling phosphodiesterase CbiR [Desulfobacterales bacterium]|nr:cobamide remodeling phosphodiesterase CbiR [Desulfobacterales bacterium]